MNALLRSRVLALCLMLAAAIVHGPSHATTAAPGAPHPMQPRHLMQLQHTVWTARDGIPAVANALAQTRDGYLWIGASDGVVRFDGISFERFDPGPGALPDTDVYALHARADGSLWVGWRMGGITRIERGKITNVAQGDGIPNGSIWGFAEDRSGRLWAAGLAGLARFDGTRWHQIGPDDGFTARTASAVFADRDGTVAVFSERGLFLLAPGATRFAAPIAGPTVRQPPLRAPDGTLYTMQKEGIRVIDTLAGYGARTHPLLVDYGDEVNGFMLASADGALWFDTEAGLIRQPDAERAAVVPGTQRSPGAQLIRRETGLSGRIVVAMLEDRDGAVWIATDGGLDRFRRASAVPLLHDGEPQALHHMDILANPDNSVDLFGRTTPFAWLHGGMDGVSKRPGATVARVQLRARDGSLWRGVGRRLDYIPPGGAQRSVALPDDTPPTAMVHALAEGADGALWVSAIQAGVQRYKDGIWDRDTRLPRAGMDTALSLGVDRQGRLWTGYRENRIVMRTDAGVRTFDAAGGLQLGQVTALRDVHGALWAFGSNGAAILQGERFVPLQFSGFELRSVAAVADAPDGALWLNTGVGLVRIDAAAAKAAASAPLVPVPARRYGPLDNVVGSVGSLDQQSIAVTGDGVVWFSTSAGVFWLDQRQGAVQADAPTVQITRAHAGATVNDPITVTLAAGQRNVSFDYTAPVLALAERVRYRYRLHGYDDAWQDAGARHQAYYTGLEPGRYRFEVIASTPQGAWTGAPASVEVQVQPQFQQTLWFKLLIASLGLGALYSLHRLRLHVVERRLRALAQVQQAERARIARELHDTLLQAIQALVLRFHILAARLPAADPLHLEMERALDTADDVLQDGRDRVQGLRVDHVPSGDLAAALRREGALLAREHGPALVVTCLGTVRALAPACEVQCYRIALEAIGNAMHHSGAAGVNVTLAWRPEAFVVTVADDGRGIPADVIAHGRNRHFGLQGMRERAADIGATLAFDTAAGTTVTLTVPAPRAYLA